MKDDPADRTSVPPIRAASGADAPASAAGPDAPRQAGGIPTTPMFRQYHEAKDAHPDAIVMFRMGDFYEMFFEDAVTASKILDLTLTTRGKGTSTEAPMCGVPAHAAEAYIARLVRSGRRVAICEQMEDPRKAKGLVAREVVRVLSPGTLTDPAALEARVAAYVAAIAPSDGVTGLAFADLSTGEFLAWEGDAERAREILAGYAPREVLHPEEAIPLAIAVEGRAGPLLSPRPGWTFAEASAQRALLTHFGVITLDGFGLSGRPGAIRAAGALLCFLKETQKSPLGHLSALKIVDTASCLVVDHTTRRNLEIVRPLSGEEDGATLLGVLDLTQTAMGGRRLRECLLRPLVERSRIEARHEAVGEILEARSVREAVRGLLGTLPDLERLLGRVALRKAAPRDVHALQRALARFEPIREAIATLCAPLIDETRRGIADLRDLAADLARAISDDPPPTAREGGVIRDGYDPDVDRWRSARKTARSTMAHLESRERKRTGIGTLKVRFNNVFGYYLEVSRSHLASVPSDYIRKQTLVGAERFVTPELKQFEETLFKAETELIEREQTLFAAVLDRAAARSDEIRTSARALAEVDLLASFAEAAERYDYVRPRLTDDPVLRITAGRHPVVERLAGIERFIANDLTMDSQREQVLVLTGPNMGGKSTYLRQTALIVLMAQAGCFVPAESAEIGIADRIFCRVGASDNLAGGQSTFLVEMSETANILHSSSSRSLVLLDEIGRGTSTFDGLSIAWAVAEWLHENPTARPRSLFATHYHELTELALLYPRIKNLHISAREYKDTVLFLRRVEEGPADRSYGIQVARLAGLPHSVIARALEVLRNLERSEFGRDGIPLLARREDGLPRADQLTLFAPDHDADLGVETDPAAQAERSDGRTKGPALAPVSAAQAPGETEPVAHAILEELGRLDPDGLTPLDALRILARWKRGLEPRS